MEEAFYYAQDLYKSPIQGDGIVCRQAVFAACEVLANGDYELWQQVWTVIQQYTDFGKAVMLRLAASMGYRKYTFINDLSEDDFSSIYIWLCRYFPYTEDPKNDGAHAVGHREQLTHFRDGILERLKMMGTWKACEMIEKIKQATGYEWLAYISYMARQNALLKTSKPYPVKDILQWGTKKGECEKSTERKVAIIDSGTKSLTVKAKDNENKKTF